MLAVGGVSVHTWWANRDSFQNFQKPPPKRKVKHAFSLQCKQSAATLS